MFEDEHKQYGCYINHPPPCQSLFHIDIWLKIAFVCAIIHLFNKAINNNLTEQIGYEI